VAGPATRREPDEVGSVDVTTPIAQLRPARVDAVPVRVLADEFGLEVSATDEGDVAVIGVTMASDDVRPGELFAAVPGARVHGATFAPGAIEAGASAVLTDPAGARLLREESTLVPGVPSVPVLVAEDPRAVVGPLAARVYGHPARGLVVAGVTGTNGKTTTSYLLDAALRTAHDRTAVLGTVELRIGDVAVESPRTTVEAPVLHRLLALAREQGVGAVSLEVSSHALALHRVDGLVVDVAGFTNLTRDHLDFHGDMAGYYRDKALLFTPEHSRRGIVCVDDDWSATLGEEATVPVERLRTRDGDRPADWVVSDVRLGLDGVASTFTLTGPQGVRVRAACPLPGRVNVSNAALAVVMAFRAGVDLDAAVDAVARMTGVPGRMERVGERGAGRPLAIVDYAHTPDALELALDAVRPITPGRVILVFGSDGDRDQGKRPIMGAIAARLADVVVVTDENPRSEDPATIRAAILDGVREVRGAALTDVHEADNRVDALRRAVEIATEADTIIVTGKGHEPTQEVAGVFHRYNDRPALRDALAERWGPA
jgi:UDP-N-acetylmuramoyl-L-alanyl-D-glutamate--2,6-diaminopimelate ligase